CHAGRVRNDVRELAEDAPLLAAPRAVAAPTPAGAGLPGPRPGQDLRARSIPRRRRGLVGGDAAARAALSDAPAAPARPEHEREEQADAADDHQDDADGGDVD